MSIDIRLAGIQSLPSPEDRALALLEVTYNEQTYNWSLFIPHGEELNTYIENNKAKIQSQIDAKELEWTNLEPKTRTVQSPFDIEPQTVAIPKEEIVRPDVPDYYALRRSSYPSIGDQLDALWKGTTSTEFQTLLAKIQAVKDQFPKN